MINILFFLSNLSEGGAEKVLRNLVNNMDQSKFDITVQTVEKEDASKYLAQGIRYKYLNKSKTKIGNKLFHLWFRLLTELKLTYSFYIKNNYDIEVAYLECGPTKVMAGSTNKKAVKLAWVHCDVSKNPSIYSNVNKLREQYKCYDKIMCVSSGVEDAFNSLFDMNEKTDTLINVIDEEEIYSKADLYEPSIDKNKKSILAVGRLSKVKCYDKLINDCARLINDGIELQLNILGDGPERENLQALINKLNMTDSTRLLGFCSNPYPYIKQSDIIACSSKFEGFSTVVTEAILLGKIVVTTPCAGMQELLGDSEYGIIAEDTDDGLYNALKSVLTDSELEAHYNKKAAERKECFKKKHIVEETQQLFENLVREKKND